MAEREASLPTPAEVQAFLASPLPAGRTRTMSCGLCGVVTYIRFSGDDMGSGDPIRHLLYHRERGES